MKTALKETYFCDYSHPSIKRVITNLSQESEDPVETAKRCFYFVRDTIVTGYDLYETKASDILKNGYGICWGKSILLLTILRGCKISSHFGTIPVHRKFIEPLIGPLYHLANSPYNHCVVHAWLNDRWTILDPVLDPATFQTFFAPRGVDWKIGWNGTGDCRLYTESVVGDPIMHTDVDQTIRNKAGNTELPAFMARLANRFMNKRIWQKTMLLKKGASVSRPSVN